MTAIWRSHAHGLEEHTLDRAVISCEDTAEAKGHPVSHEVKSLLLDTSVGLVAVHLRGDRALALRKVKRALGCRESKLADRAVLADLGLEVGAVYPFHEGLADVQHVVSESVMEQTWVSTSSGRVDRYLIFDPSLLLTLDLVAVHDVERTPTA